MNSWQMVIFSNEISNFFRLTLNNKHFKMITFIDRDCTLSEKRNPKKIEHKLTKKKNTDCHVPYINKFIRILGQLFMSKIHFIRKKKL